MISFVICIIIAMIIGSDYLLLLLLLGIPKFPLGGGWKWANFLQFVFFFAVLFASLLLSLLLFLCEQFFFGVFNTANNFVDVFVRIDISLVRRRLCHLRHRR